MSTLPWCAVCRRPVDELLHRDDPVTMDHVFVARCHGASEIVHIHHFDIANGMTVEPGQAFGPELSLGPVPL